MNLSDLSDQTGPCHFDPGHTGPSYSISSQNGSCLVKGTNLNNSRSTVKDLQENFNKSSSTNQRQASFNMTERKTHAVLQPSNSNPILDKSSMELNKVSTVSKRLEDLRKKSSLDFQIGLGREGSLRKSDKDISEISVLNNSTSSKPKSSILDKKLNEEVVINKVDLETGEQEVDGPTPSDPRSCQINIKEELDLSVGFSSLPDQIYRKSLRKGFHLVILVLGESGLGKSTFINSLFLTQVYSSNNQSSDKIEKTNEIREHQVNLEENGVKLSLTVVDTPGFGDGLDNSNCWDTSLTYIDSQFDTFLQEETRVVRSKLPDKRVHACLYFISPNGHGLKHIDIECMKRLHTKVNIIPVIGKSDACTMDELVVFKKKIREQLKENDINIYKFPREEDEPESQIDVNNNLPFAVVGSNVMIEDDLTGRKFRGRKYPWGCVNIEDECHSDFSLLRKLLLCQHTQDLIDTTICVHYENYRYEKLSKLVLEEELSKNKNPLAAIEDTKKEHEEKLNRMSVEMDSVLEMKLKEKKDSLETLNVKEEDVVKKEQQHLDLEKAELENRRVQFDRDRVEWATRLRLHSSKSTESLNKKKHFRLSVGAFKFGRQ